MKKKLLFPCLLLTAAMLLTCVFAIGASAAQLTMTDVASGAKTPAAGDIVTIANEAELAAFSKYVSNGGVTEGITFRLDADIALPNTDDVTNLNPVGGTYNGVAEAVAFKGTFDGNGKTISNIFLTNKYRVNAGDDVLTADKKNTASSQYTGIFAMLDGATVKDLVVTFGAIYRVGVNGDFGLISSYAKNSNVIGCTVMTQDGIKDYEVAAKSTGFAGVIGYAEDSVIDGCNVNVVAQTSTNAAGVVVTAQNTAIRNCVVGGTYTNKKAGALGGVAALLNGTSSVENCYSFVTLNTTQKNTVLGGVVATVGEGARVENCFSAAHVTSGANYTYGTLIGINNGTIANAFGLRDAATSESEGHSDIGENNGETKDIYAYQPQADGDKTNFVVGSVVMEDKEYPCTDGSCTEEAADPDCRVCNGAGKVTRLAYVFKPTENSDIASLDGALNAWIEAKKGSSDVKYANWVVSGSTIVNCSHVIHTYKAQEGKAPTCVATGHGDLVCATCGTIITADVEIPADPNAHASADGKVYVCADYECVHCEKTIKATEKHVIDETKPCADQLCTRCRQEVEATEKHTKPADFDASKPCMEYQCTVCGTKAHDAEHDAPEVKYSCQQSVCKVCSTVVQEGGAHFAGLAANCERAQICLDCGDVINPPKGHKWGEAATCGKAQVCVDCGKANPDAPATGEHVGDREAPTCTLGVYCVVCDKRMKGPAGHKVDPEETIDCGHGKSCTICHTILESATGEHSIDWSGATVVRPATADRTGIIEAECDDCGRMFEAYTTYQVTEGAGMIQIYDTNATIFTGTKLLLTIGKVKDYKDIALADGYLPLQAATAMLVDVAGDSLYFGGETLVKMILNKSAAKMAVEKLKVYQIVGDKATELEIVSMADGYITFKSAGIGVFVVAGEKEAAFDTIGAVQTKNTVVVINPVAAATPDTLATVKTEQVIACEVIDEIQPKQTAALVGIAVEEKKDEV